LSKVDFSTLLAGSANFTIARAIAELIAGIDVVGEKKGLGYQLFP
jgi:hypothetical protein